MEKKHLSAVLVLQGQSITEIRIAMAYSSLAKMIKDELDKHTMPAVQKVLTNQINRHVIDINKHCEEAINSVRRTTAYLQAINVEDTNVNRFPAKKSAVA